ncbi:MAG TPA: adenosylcobalamin-dependent ribonucleoside-diphosphate reductase [Candidatus Nanoarchaeia archaeon]|nr:adenosylcobalamin-dependent ribonucleoside-diphosphate reductase [Candidatus Nanoarchaeia archaeon]
MEKKRQKILLTENQEKVIKDKYLKDAPSVEAWLDLVASNIALADVLHSKLVPLHQMYNGVSYKILEKEVFEKKTLKMFLLHHGLVSLNERSANFKKFLNNLHLIVRDNTQVAALYEKTRDEFYNLMANFEFLPNSPTLMNAGRPLQQLSACYVLPIEDSIEGWMKTAMDTAIIHQSGGGTGFSASRVRPKGDFVKSTSGVASGPLSPFKIIDSVTQQVRQGGMRRGANMGILSVYHPDIMDFIHCKKQKGFLDNFNISVAIDERFMEKVKKNEEFELVNPRNNEVVKRLNAKEVFDQMVQSAWETGDPGFVVIDRINNTDSNPTPHLGQIESTNPCGEQPLLPYEPCNLGSITLSKFVNSTNTDMDWERLKKCVHLCVHFLDNVIDMNNYPLPEIEVLAKGNRRIGLGVMGWAEALAMMRVPYNSEKALSKAEEVMKFIDNEALAASERLAAERGVFPNWKSSIFDRHGPHFRGKEFKPRHCARTTIAPTGTIAIAAGLQGSGIEPFFAIVYVRYNAKAIDALKNGEKPEAKDTFYEINPLFRKVAQEHNFFGLKEQELWDKIEKNHKAVLGIPEIPVDIQKIFLTSHDLSPLDHCRAQVAFQKYTNNAVSKTVNLRNEATAEEVREVYMLAYEKGCKGVTIYRDGSKSEQVLNLSEKKKEEKQVAMEQIRVRKRNAMEQSDYYEIMTGYGPLHVHINYDEVGPTKMFVNLSPAGTEISGLACSLGIMISKYLQSGGNPVRLLKHLNSIKGDKPFGFGPKRVDSIPHGLSKALRDHLIKTGKIPSFDGQMKLAEAQQMQQPVLPSVEQIDGAHISKGSFIEVGPQSRKEAEVLAAIEDTAYLASSLYCPKCFSANVGIVSGCSKPTCFDCGFSECG